MEFTAHDSAPAFDEEVASIIADAKAIVRATGCDFVNAVRRVEQNRQQQISADVGRVTLRLYAVADVANGEFSGLAYSGNAISYNDERLVIDLASLALPPGGRVPILLNHDSNQVAGRAVAEITGGGLWIRRGEFSKSTAAGREAAGLHAEKQPLKLSIGVGDGRREHMRSGGRAMLINGRLQSVGVVLRKARLLEVSIVPAGADPAAALD